MTRTFRHIALPAMAPLLFMAVAAIPVETIGCRNRGLLAVCIVFVSLMAALVCAVMALKGRLRSDPLSLWWVVSALILIVPAIALLILA